MFPNKLTAQIGSTVVFTCLSPGLVKWFFQDGPLPDNVVSTDQEQYHVLHIVKVQEDNTGRYKCQAVIDTGESSDSDITGFLEVYGEYCVSLKYIFCVN